MIQAGKCYRVKVETTNGLGNTTCNRSTGAYRDCVGGVVYVTTNYPETIFQTFGVNSVLSIELVGVGYFLEMELETT
jgi:hypothetical protein